MADAIRPSDYRNAAEAIERCLEAREIAAAICRG